MKRLLTNSMLGFSTFFAILISPACQAQQPSVVASIRSIDTVLDDIDFLATEAGSPGVKKGAEAYIQFVTNNRGLKVIDRKKPLGVYWNVAEDSAVAFVPVSDSAGFTKALSELTANFKEEDGVLSFVINGNRLSAKIVDGYCFASPAPGALSSVADPSKIVNSNLDVAIDVNLASIPASYKQVFLGMAEDNGRQELAKGRQPQSKHEEEARDFGFEAALGILKSVTNHGDRLTIGYDINQEKRNVGLEIRLTAQSNSDLAGAMSVFSKTTSPFANLGSDNAVFRGIFSFPTVGMASGLEKLVNLINDAAFEGISHSEGLSDEGARSIAKSYVSRITDLIKATVRSGSVNSGLVLNTTEDRKLQVIFAGRSAKGDDISQLMNDALGLLKNHPDYAEVEIDVAKHGAARIHSIDPQLDDDDDISELLGDSPIHMTIIKNDYLVALGPKNLDALKKSLDQFTSSKVRATAPISLTLRPAAIMLMVEKDNEELLERAREVATKPGDKISLEVAPVTGGATLRLEFGVDLLGMSHRD